VVETPVEFGGRPLVPLVVVSVFAVGQNPPLGFFLTAYEPESPFPAVLEF
jgi:hypothetical protein